MDKRYIGIRHRVKRNAEGEALPTAVCIVQGGVATIHELTTEQDELDFVLGCLPTEWQKPPEGFDATTAGIKDHHIIREGEKVKKIPSTYTGLQSGDTVAMVLGGSGDYLAFALAKQGQKIGATVMRIPSSILKAERGDAPKKNDASLLAKLAETKPASFSEVSVRDETLIIIRERLRIRMDTMGARMACEQRLRQRSIGQIFCNPEGMFSEGSLEKQFGETKANDAVLKALLTEERLANKALEKALKVSEVYKEIFAKVDGCGVSIASQLLATIMDIRRFETDAKLKKFVGVAVDDGRFPRRRKGEVSRWNPSARQALYLLADQFNRRPESVWGMKLLEIKLALRAKHPEVITDGTGKKRYTNGHIHKMALWRAVTKFTEWLWKEWWKLERGQQAKLRQAS
jgi:transposase